MARRLPPLNALRAFEAAARHLSFTRAADELNVSQAAISHQVKALEERLGVLLFRRLNRNLALTEAGAAYLPDVSLAFDRLADATTRLRRITTNPRLTISVLPSFAAKWLMPRLKSLWAAHPDLEVRFSASERLVDFQSEDVDLAIRYGSGNWPGLRVDAFLTEELFPVCSPALRDGDPPLHAPADLARHTLIHDEMREDWRMWLLAAQVTGIDATKGPSFSHSSMVLTAAIDGHGVALGRSALVADDLAAGRLVRPFAVSIPADFAYYLVCPVETADSPNIAAFRSWLLSQAQELPV